MLADLKQKALQCRAGVSDLFEAHRKRPLSEHLADFQKSLEHKGNTATHCHQVAKLARHSSVELTLGRHTHAGLFDLSSAVNALPPLLIHDAPQNDQNVMRATGDDPKTGAFTGPTTGPKSVKKLGPVRPKLAQTPDDARKQLIAIDDTNSDLPPKEKPRIDRGV